MTEEMQQNTQAIKKKLLRWVVVTSVVASVSKQILTGLVGMPRPLAYDYLPVPKWSFKNYIIGFGSVLVGWVSAIYVAVPYLKIFLPSVLAYGISFLAYGALLYFTFKSVNPTSNILKNS
jgi:heme/copper-type cytochrome/quinol oxidase subunit 1